MNSLAASIDTFDKKVTTWMAHHGVVLLRIALGIIFFWFGILKFFPQTSPAEELAGRTISTLSFGLVTPNISLPVLALWETVIGLGLVFGVFLRATLLLLFLQMSGTLLPLAFFPHEVFLHFPYAPTLEGQYIIKNLVLIAAGIVIGATARGGRLIADPKVAREARAKETARMESSSGAIP